MENNRLKQLLSENRTLVMGILNVTPDSFSDGGRFYKTDIAIKHALEMVSEGADIVDIGGESTRPGFTPVSVDEECSRVIPVIKELHEESDVVISVDTTKYEVADEAVKAGASIINDISCLQDISLAELAVKTDSYYVLMHNRPEINYTDFEKDYLADIDHALKQLETIGLSKDKIILDPGVGFAKDKDQNLFVIKNLQLLTKYELPVLLAASRKSVIGAVLDATKEERYEGTLALSAYGVLNGADMVRVHDVKGNVQLVRMLEAVKNYG